MELIAEKIVLNLTGKWLREERMRLYERLEQRAVIDIALCFFVVMQCTARSRRNRSDSAFAFGDGSGKL